MKNINKLIVPLFAMEGPDLSVKAAKLRNNIRHGKELDPVGKPVSYTHLTLPTNSRV